MALQTTKISDYKLLEGGQKAHIHMTGEETQAKAASLRHKIAKLGEEWGRLDFSGSQSVQGNNCRRKMKLLEEELKELSGEKY